MGLWEGAAKGEDRGGAGEREALGWGSLLEGLKGPRLWTGDCKSPRNVSPRRPGHGGNQVIWGPLLL